jgi:hypothetical protein
MGEDADKLISMLTRSTIKLSKQSKTLLAAAQRTCDAVRETCKDVRRSLGHGSAGEYPDTDVISPAKASKRRRRRASHGGEDQVGLSQGG